MILNAKQGLIPSILGVLELLKRFSEVGFNFPDDKDIPNFGAKTKLHLINAVLYIPETVGFVSFCCRFVGEKGKIRLFSKS